MHGVFLKITFCSFSTSLQVCVYYIRSKSLSSSNHFFFYLQVFFLLHFCYFVCVTERTRVRNKLYCATWNEVLQNSHVASKLYFSSRTCLEWQLAVLLIFIVSKKVLLSASYADAEGDRIENVLLFVTSTLTTNGDKINVIFMFNTPYSKMAENTLLFCLIVNWPLLPRSHLQNSKEYLA